MIIDLAAVPFLDSSGVGVLLTFYRRLSEQGMAFSVCCPQPQPHQVLALTAADKIVDVRATTSEALT